MRAMIEIYCASYAPPAAVTLDIDDTVDVVHGHQQLSMFNTHYGERCFLPIHVYDTATGRPVAVLLRSGKTPSGRRCAVICGVSCAASAGIGRDTHITIRGDSHYGRPEVMDLCEAKASTTSSAWRQRRAGPPGRARCRRCAGALGRGRRGGDPPLCRDALRRELVECRAARRRAHRGHLQGLDIRYVVTNITLAARNGSTTPSIARAVRPRT